MNDSANSYRLGVDVGGTHTDLVLLDTRTGDTQVDKVSTTPHNPSEGVLNGIRKLLANGIDPAQIGFFGHGTTITTNALLEMRGSRTGLLVTDGFRGIQEVQTLARDGNLFDYFYNKPEPIAPQSATREIPGRMDYQGNILEPLDTESIRRAARELKAQNIESIAVCYLFSFMNDVFEQTTKAILKEEHPDAFVSISSEVLPRIREWSRMSATLLNAYLEPVLIRYIRDLNNGLDELGITTQQRFLMQSNGGVMPFQAAIHGGKTVHTLFSGPAGGATASTFLSGEFSKTGLVTLDMGGTSADIAFIEGGMPLETNEGTIARRQVDVPALDMTTISAGGGSIAGLDKGGLITVGPQSAGATPGPACYDRGGDAPTVTDADLVCGYLNPDYFLGGSQKLNIDSAKTALTRKLGEAFGDNPVKAAFGIRQLVDMRMADEIRVFAAKRGVDHSQYTLLPFGGAGSVHAAAVAEELGIKRVMIPDRPGAFSAMGLLCTDVMHDYIQSGLKPLNSLSADEIDGELRRLESRAHSDLANEGLGEAEARFQRDLDLRYVGQGYEVTVSLNDLPSSTEAADRTQAIKALFDVKHKKIHGHAARDRELEVVNYRLRVTVDVPKFEPKSARGNAAAGSTETAVKGQRAMTFDGNHFVDAVIYDRTRLSTGNQLAGPAAIEQFDATILVPPGWNARVDDDRNILLEQETA